MRFLLAELVLGPDNKWSRDQVVCKSIDFDFKKVEKKKGLASPRLFFFFLFDSSFDISFAKILYIYIHIIRFFLN